MNYDVIEEDDVGYGLECSIDVNVDDELYETDYTKRITGRLTRRISSDNNTVIGTLYLYWVQVAASRFAALDVFDALNRTTEEYGRLLYPKGADEFSEEVLEQFQMGLVHCTYYMLNTAGVALCEHIPARGTIGSNYAPRVNRSGCLPLRLHMKDWI